MYQLFAQHDSRLPLEGTDSQLLTFKIVMALWPLTRIAKIELPDLRDSSKLR